MRFLDYLEAQLASLDAQGLLRTPEGRPGGDLLDICTNDYLGYAGRPVSRETLSSLGAGASRLIYGTHASHSELEAAVADWVACESGLLFSSGYAANLGTIAALAGPEDLVVSDRLNHASIVDGCRLSRAQIAVVPHRDAEAVAAALKSPARGRRWVVTESYFSMDGDSPDLPRLRTICDDFGAGLIVDEAHAMGVFGPSGGGRCRELGVVADVLVAGLGKGVGALGAVVTGPQVLRTFLWNRARSFVFSTAPSPLATYATLHRVAQVRADDEARGRLWALVRRFETAVSPLSEFLPPDRMGPIFPVILRRPERAAQIVRELRSRGFLAQAIRPPTVPSGESRIRIALHADLGPEDADRLAASLLELCSGS